MKILIGTMTVGSLLVGATSCSNSNAQNNEQMKNQEKMNDLAISNACQSDGTCIASGMNESYSHEQLMDLLPNEFTELNEDEKKISLQIYRLLKLGSPVDVRSISESSGVNLGIVEQKLKSWPGIFLDDDGKLIGYWGLTIKDFGHKIIAGGQTLYAWCAWDALFIPQLINEETTIISRDHNTGKKLEIVVSGTGELVSYPKGLTMSIMVPSDEKSNDEIRKDVVSNFCHFIYFFEDEKSGMEFIDANPNTVLLSVEEAVELSQYKNKRQYGEYIQNL